MRQIPVWVLASCVGGFVFGDPGHGILRRVRAAAPPSSSAYRLNPANDACTLHDARSRPADDPIVDPVDGSITGYRHTVEDLNEPLRLLLSLLSDPKVGASSKAMEETFASPAKLTALLNAKERQIVRAGEEESEANGDAVQRAWSNVLDTYRKAGLDPEVPHKNDGPDDLLAAVSSLRAESETLSQERRRAFEEAHRERTSPSVDLARLAALDEAAEAAEEREGYFREELKGWARGAPVPESLWKDPTYVSWRQRNRGKLQVLAASRELDAASSRQYDSCYAALERYRSFLRNRVILEALLKGKPPGAEHIRALVLQNGSQRFDGGFIEVKSASTDPDQRRRIAGNPVLVAEQVGDRRFRADRHFSLPESPPEVRWLKCKDAIVESDEVELERQLKERFSICYRLAAGR